MNTRRWLLHADGHPNAKNVDISEANVNNFAFAAQSPGHRQGVTTAERALLFNEGRNFSETNRPQRI
jgi:hypothetical protein